MSLCPVCGRYLCDHSAAERGQTPEEMDRPFTKEELQAWVEHPDSTGYVPEKLAAARKYQHHVFTEEDKQEVDAYRKELEQERTG